jgi:hypothetical protein
LSPAIKIGLMIVFSLVCSACCKSIQCRVLKEAKRDMQCDAEALQLKDITQEVKKMRKNDPDDREYRRVRGCTREAFYECNPADKTSLDVDTYRAEAHPHRTLGDTSWRCWQIPDPFTPPPKPGDSPPVD